MNEEFLKKLGLSDEVIEKIMAEHSKSVAETEQKLTTAESEATTLKEQLQKRDDDIATLKQNAGSNEELKGQLDSLQEKYDKDTADLQASMAESKLNYKVDLALKDANALNGTAVKALLNMDSIKMNDKDELEGLTEQIENLQKAEDSSMLFKQAEANPAPPNWSVGGNHNNSGNNEPTWKDRLSANVAKIKQ
ncbi:scaffolding protein [Bacillus cereus]|uniref:Scaffolding protein n=1 Tax=Bacillus cereus TaxID=1396 RepID=A0A9X9F796_BACCE|nr:scaffolding protein [Bacillus cereus]